MANRRPKKARGFREAQAGFRSAVDLEPVFAAYGYACAFTGRDLREYFEADPLLALLRIATMDRSGDLRPDLVIPARPEAIWAYERGYLSVGPAHNFLLDWSRIDKRLVAMLNEDGRLRMPSSPAHYPNALVLAEHRKALVDGDFAPH